MEENASVFGSKLKLTGGKNESWKETEKLTSSGQFYVLAELIRRRLFQSANPKIGLLHTQFEIKN